MCLLQIDECPLIFNLSTFLTYACTSHYKLSQIRLLSIQFTALSIL